MYGKTLTILGAVTALIIAIRFLRFLHIYLRPSSLHRYARPGAWALVTGSSDGIGLAFAQELASRGFNIVLHGRNAVKLDGVKAGILKAHPGVQVRVLVVDATSSHGMRKSIEGMVQAVSELGGPLTVLISNVGGTPMIPETFRAMENFSSQDVDDMINLNVRFTMQLTRALLPLLNKSSPALIMNLGSIAGTSGLPFVPLYSGAKAMCMLFSVGLTRELRCLKQDIECIAFIVGTVTNTSGMRKPAATLFLPDATTLVRAALQKVGCGRPLVAAYWWHAVLYFITDAIPEPLASMFIQDKILSVKASGIIGREKES